MEDEGNIQGIEAVKQSAGKLHCNSGQVVIGITGGHVRHGEIIQDLQHGYSRERLYLSCIGAYMTPGRKVYVVYKLSDGEVCVIDDKIDFKKYLPFNELISVSLE